MQQLKNILIGALLILIQVTILGLLSVHGVRPDLVVLFVIHRSLSEGPTAGVIWGFGLGLILDAVSAGSLGLGALAYAVTGFVCGQIGHGTVLTRLKYLSAIAVGALITFAIFLYFRLPLNVVGWTTPIFTSALPGAIYTWALAVIWFYSPFSRMPGEKDRGES